MSGVDVVVCSCGHTGWAHGVVSFADPDARGACHHYAEGRAACRCEAFTPRTPAVTHTAPTVTLQPPSVTDGPPSVTDGPQSVARAAGDRITRARTFGASWAHLAAWIATGDHEHLAAAITTLTDGATA